MALNRQKYSKCKDFSSKTLYFFRIQKTKKCATPRTLIIQNNIYENLLCSKKHTFTCKIPSLLYTCPAHVLSGTFEVRSVKILSKNTQYAPSGNMFSRCFFVHKTYKHHPEKQLIICASAHDQNILTRNLRILFDDPGVRTIQTINDALIFLSATDGIWVMSVEFFSLPFPSEYERNKLFLDISLHDTLERKDIIERLTQGTYQHKKHLTSGSYHVEGDLVSIWPHGSDQIYKVSLFDTEVDGIFSSQPEAPEAFQDHTHIRIPLLQTKEDAQPTNTTHFDMLTIAKTTPVWCV